MEYLKLHNEIKMPQLGFGVAAIGKFGLNDSYVVEVLEKAIEVGFRHFDCAAVYGNEESLGKAIKNSGIKREEFFVTSKLGPDDMGYESGLKAFEKSLKALNLDYLDLYLLHWPLKEKFLETWKVLEKVYDEGLTKSIGGSNFAIKHFDALEAKSNTKPMVDQIEINPYNSQPKMQEYCIKEGVALTAWSPLGAGNWNDVPQDKKPIADEKIIQISKKYQKSPAQLILRWILQLGISVVPKSEKEHRMKENLNIFDFKLEDDDMKKMNLLNKDFSIGIQYNEGNKKLMSLI